MKLRAHVAMAAFLGALAMSTARAEYLFEQHLFGNDVRRLAVDGSTLYWATRSGLVAMGLADTSLVVHRRRDRGLPSDSLNALAIDAAGNVWCGTESGAAVLVPGGRWEIVSTFDGLPHPRVQALEAQAGEVLIGTSEGYVSLTDIETKEVTRSCTILDPCADDFPSLDITVTKRVSPEEQWFGTSAGPVVVRTTGASTETEIVTSGLTNVAVEDFASFDGDFWVGTGDGAYRFDSGLVAWQPTPGMIDPDGAAAEASSFLVAGSRLLCASVSGRRVFEWNGTAWQRVGSDFSSNARPQTLVQDGSGVIWCGSGNGVRSLNATSTAWSSPIGVRGLTANSSVWSVAVGARPETWFGYQASSEAAAFDGERWTAITEASTQSGFERRPVQGLLVDPGGSVWFGHCCCTGPGCFTDRASGDDARALDWLRIPARNVRAIAQDTQGNLFLGSAAEDPAVNGAGLYYWRASFGADSVRVITAPGSIVDNTIAGLAFDAAGSLWIGYRSDGLQRWSFGASPIDDPATDSTEYYRAGAHEIISDQVLCLAADGNRVWAGTTRGVSLYVDGAHNADFGTFYFEDPFVTALAIAADHSAWGGTPAGVTRLVPNAIGTYDVETYRFPDLPNSRVNAIAARGLEVWIATSRGVAVGRPSGEAPGANPLARGIAYPNPFRASAHDGIRLADLTVPVDVDVYDATGARVASSRAVSPGGIAWDGLVEGGLASPGIYVVVARSGDLTLTTRVAVLH